MTDEDPKGAEESGRKRVLVVDDEVLIGRAITRLLKDSFDIVCVTSGAEALAQLAVPDSFDAVLCDLSMPGMSGREVYGALETTAPWVLSRFAFVSGGALDEATRVFLERSRGPRLSKPFDAQELRRVVESLAAGGASPTK